MRSRSPSRRRAQGLQGGRAPRVTTVWFEKLAPAQGGVWERRPSHREQEKRWSLLHLSRPGGVPWRPASEWPTSQCLGRYITRGHFAVHEATP